MTLALTQPSRSLTESTHSRAWRDAKGVFGKYRFKIPAYALLALAAALGALLPQDAATSMRVALAVAGAVGGPLILGLLVILALLIAAPTRQRDEARASLPDRTTLLGDDARTLGDEIHAIYQGYKAHEVRRVMFDSDAVKRNNEALADAKERYHREVAVRALTLYDQLAEAGYSLEGFERHDVSDPENLARIAELGGALNVLAEQLRGPAYANLSPRDRLHARLDDCIRAGQDLRDRLITDDEPDDGFENAVSSWETEGQAIVRQAAPAYLDEYSSQSLFILSKQHGELKARVAARLRVLVKVRTDGAAQSSGLLG